MHEPPSGVSDAAVLDVVREHWRPGCASVEHLAVGFGAWHWRARDPAGDLFVTLDPPAHHTAATLEATYAAAATLDADLVHPSLRTRSGPYTVPLADGWVSCTPWLAGGRPDAWDAEAAGLLERLHASPCPPGTVTWEPLVDADLAERLEERSRDPWREGPHGPEAHRVLLDGLPTVAAALGEYLDLGRRLDPTTYVATHGEPGVQNLWRTDDGRLLLLDWESLRRAPRERDLLDGRDALLPGDPALVRLFRLEWSLAEVEAYADWLRAPHGDGADERVAVKALAQNLTALAP